MKLALVGITGQNRIPYLQEHKVDLLLSVGESPEREKVIDFTDRLCALLHRRDGAAFARSDRRRPIWRASPSASIAARWKTPR